MSRKIKFRIWDKKLGMCNEPIVSAGEINKQFVNRKGVVMQYTGIKDKNGVKIYEGDIVKTEEHGVGEIFWFDIEASFAIKYPNNSQIYTLVFVNEIGKVIGNIYENPELLQEKK